MKKNTGMVMFLAVLLALFILAVPLISACATPAPTPAPAPTAKPTPAATPSPTAAPSPKPAATPTASPAPTKSPLPKVPITYASDTDATIIRRAQWIEAAQKEGVLVWWGGTATDLVSKSIADFNKVYPFIKVNYFRMDTVETKIDEEGVSGRTGGDIALGGEPQNYPRWRVKGLLAKFTDIIPGIEKWDKRIYGSLGDWVTAGPNTTTPQYNSKLIPAAEAPKTWEDLLNPKWKGFMGVNSSMKVWYYLAVEEGGWGLDKTEQFLKKLAEQKPIWGVSYAGMTTLLSAGETKILSDNFLFYALDAQKKGAPVEIVKASPAVVTGSSVVMLKNAAHPNASKLFLEWFFSPQGLQSYEAATGKGDPSPGAGTQAAKLMQGVPLVYRTEAGDNKIAELDLPNRFGKILGLTP